MSRIRLDDFTGGITDFIFSGDANQCEICDNYLITKEGGLQTRNGAHLYDSDNPQIPAGNQRIGHLYEFEEELLIQSSTKVYRNFINMTGPGGLDVFLSGNVGNYVDFAEWNGQLIAVSDSFSAPSKIYKDDTGTFRVRTAGLPELASNPTITPDANDGKNYLYRFIYFFEYNVKGITHRDFGPYIQIETTNSVDFSGVGHYNQITQIPALLGLNYDSANIKVHIYRTVHNGTVFFKAGEVSYVGGPNMPDFEDTVDDNDLLLNQLMYTEGGVVENDQCPPAKFITMANNIMWYANVKEDGVNRYNRLRQAVQNDPDSCPVTFFYDFDSEITGLGTVGNYPIVFCKSGNVYRIEGGFDFLGRGGIIARKISDTAGCLANNSIVETGNALYWAGIDGWYTTDGFRVNRLAEDNMGKMRLRDTYATLTSSAAKQQRIYGTHDRKNRRIYWSMSGSTDNEVIFVYNQTFNSFTTISQSNSIPSALLFDDDGLIRADGRGYVFHLLDSNYNDLKIDTSISPADWYQTAIIYRWKHMAFDYNQPELTKWVNKVNLVAQNLSNLDLQINSYDNGSVIAVPLKEIEFKDVMTWGDAGWVWRDSAAIWRETKEIIKTRRMKKSSGGVSGSIRTRYKQLELTNSYTIVDWSDNSTTCTINATTKEITLTNTSFAFPNNSEGYTLTFASDNYTKEYVVTEVILGATGTAITLKVADPDGTLVDAVDEAWQLNGYTKSQRSYVDTLTYTFEVLTSKGSSYQASEADGN